jgi:hypothetical protein
MLKLKPLQRSSSMHANSYKFILNIMSVKEIRVALIGHQFMGIAHSNAYRNAAMWSDLPVKITMKCLCANDTMDNLKVFATK